MDSIFNGIQSICFSKLFHYAKMVSEQVPSIPIAILIFDNDGQIFYRAYSSTQFIANEHDQHIRTRMFEQFLADINNHISYDQLNPANNNNTNYGRLKEIHTRYIQIPYSQRNDICYFTTYVHPHCTYNPVHINSPIFFDINEANNYININPNLVHRNCPHEFI